MDPTYNYALIPRFMGRRPCLNNFFNFFCYRNAGVQSPVSGTILGKEKGGTDSVRILLLNYRYILNID